MTSRLTTPGPCGLPSTQCQGPKWRVATPELCSGLLNHQDPRSLLTGRHPRQTGGKVYLYTPGPQGVEFQYHLRFYPDNHSDKVS